MLHQEFNDYYDVIVIGAGVGGLTAAALLSKAGLTVCVLEKEPHVGGYLAGFRRKHFIFDTAIHWLNQYGPGGILDKLFNAIGSDHPKAIEQHRIRRYKGENFDYLLTDKPDEMRDQLIRDFPEEKKGIERMFLKARRIGQSFKNYNRIFRSEETMSFFQKLKNKIRLLEFAIPFIPYLSFSGEKGLKKGLNRFIKNPRLQKIFSGEQEMLGCLIPIGWSYFNDFQSPPKGGSQVIPLWLEYVVNYYQNHVGLRCKVNEIFVEKGRCTGLSFEHRGKFHRLNSKYIIAACDIETLYEKMLPADAVPAGLKKKLKKADLYSSSITVSLALDCTAESLGFNEELIHLVDENQPFNDQSGGDPNRSEISIIAPSMRDKSLAPENQGTLTLYMPACMDYKNEWETQLDIYGKRVRGEAYQHLKKEVAEILIGRVEEKLAPGLRKHILFYEVATPVTHWRYTGNKNGTMMGARPGRKNMKNKISHYRTPVKNLILGGHWAELGGGVPIAAKAGANASLLILQKENPGAFKLLAGYMNNTVSLESLNENTCFSPYNNSWLRPRTPAEASIYHTAEVVS
ncbi:MAG TPA: NAD(P)/FAD-dependent oxidoreductase [Puia sp.]|jgi:phytoene dehydrogenase-like protein|nr:NAD(P)/FAD-dependent oxidoreductase [Puia sp.]